MSKQRVRFVTECMRLLPSGSLQACAILVAVLHICQDRTTLPINRNETRKILPQLRVHDRSCCAATGIITPALVIVVPPADNESVRVTCCRTRK